MLQAKAWWDDTVVCRLFTTKKKANDYFYAYCSGTGIISQVRCINNRSFYESVIVNIDDTKVV